MTTSCRRRDDLHRPGHRLRRPLADHRADRRACAWSCWSASSAARSAAWSRSSASSTLGAAAGLSIWQFGESKDLVAGALRLDELGLIATLIAIACAAFVIPLSWREEAADDAPGPGGHGEFQALLIASVLGMALLAMAQNLVIFFVGLELLSVPLYVLCGSALRRRQSLESGLKYLIIGALGSATLLYGLAFIYGGSGSTDFAGIRDGHRRRDWPTTC